MAEYQRIEYRIAPDGTIQETVMDGLGSGCLAATQALEAELGTVGDRQFKPEYTEDEGAVDMAIQSQTL
jgi:hypothetical protein